jgi:3-dehydroquinate dehydratase-2
MRTMAKAFVTLAFLALLATAPAPAQAPPPRVRLLVVHGPNMNLLGRREPEIYGRMTLAQVNAEIEKLAKELNVETIIVQSNDEGEIVNAFQQHMDDVDGALINAAGYSFNSVAIHDVIKAVPFPTIEVHMSNLGSRDAIHQNSIITPAARATIMGLNWRSYTMAVRALAEIVREEKAKKK